MPLTYSLTGAPAPDDIAVLEQGLTDYFIQQGADPKDGKVAIFVRDDEGGIVAGLIAKIGWDQMYVSTLYVTEPVRRQGVGGQLIALVEVEARRRNCRAAWLMTSTPGGRKFYERLGYVCFGAVERHAPSCARFFMKKTLSSPSASQVECL